MYKITRTCKVLPKDIPALRHVAALVDLRDARSIWRLPRLHDPTRCLCTSPAEDKHIPYSDKILAQTKEEQRYDPTIKYEALRQCVVPIYSSDNTTTYRSYSSASLDSESETMAEEAQTQKDETRAGTSEEELRCYNPDIDYGPIVRYDVQRFAFSDDDSTDYSDSDSLTFDSADSETETETETMAEEEADTQKDKILDVTKEEELYRYDPSIKYEPLKRYVLPRFAFSDDDFSTDCSDSSASASDSETKNEFMADKEAQTRKDKILAGTNDEQLFRATVLSNSSASASLNSENEVRTVAEEKAQTQNDKILAGTKEEQLFRYDLAVSPSADLQFMAEDFAVSSSTDLHSNPGVPDSCVLLKHGVKSPTQDSIKDSKRAKEMDSYTGAEM